MFQKLIDLIIEPYTRTESRSSASVSTDLQGTSLFHYWHQSLLLLTCRAPVSFSTDLQCTSFSILTCRALVSLLTCSLLFSCFVRLSSSFVRLSSSIVRLSSCSN